MYTRKQITKELLSLLASKTCRPGIYGASEVSIDWGTDHPRYVDYMTFDPKNTTSVSGIEQGIFTCYEIKSCYEDLYSGKGLNFIGDKNYIVTTMETYKKMLPDLNNGKLKEHIRKTNPESFCMANTARSQIGIIIAVPKGRAVLDEFDRTTPLKDLSTFELKTIIQCFSCNRKRSITELLFYLMRSRRN